MENMMKFLVDLFWDAPHKEAVTVRLWPNDPEYGKKFYFANTATLGNGDSVLLKCMTLEPDYKRALMF